MQLNITDEKVELIKINLDKLKIIIIILPLIEAVAGLIPKSPEFIHFPRISA